MIDVSETKFLQKIDLATQKLKQTPGTFRLISHIDADGITAAAIISKTFERLKKPLEIEHLQTLEEKELERISKTPENTILFTDLGSGQYTLIKKHLTNKQVYILDHHETTESDTTNITHINPHTTGITNTKSISGSGVAFLFSKSIDKQNEDLAHIALIGATGDIQENRGFQGLNKHILDIATKNNLITIQETLRIFGLRTKPLIYALKQSSDHKIPGITNEETGIHKLLNKLKISPKTETKWKTFIDLTKEEQKKIIEEILIRRSIQREEIKETPENIIGPSFLITNEEEQSPLKDIKEYATIVNACGRMGKPEIARETCKGNQQKKIEALKLIKQYRTQISKAIKWMHNTTHQKGNNYIILNAQTEVPPTIIGTIASILSKSNTLKENTFILAMANQKEQNKTKISFRITGTQNNHNLKKILEEIILPINGQTGGHKEAAGAIINTKQEQQLIQNATQKFQTLTKEEQKISQANS